MLPLQEENWYIKVSSDVTYGRENLWPIGSFGDLQIKLVTVFSLFQCDLNPLANGNFMLFMYIYDKIILVTGYVVLQADYLKKMLRFSS